MPACVSEGQGAVQSLLTVREPEQKLGPRAQLHSSPVLSPEPVVSLVGGLHSPSCCIWSRISALLVPYSVPGTGKRRAELRLAQTACCTALINVFFKKEGYRHTHASLCVSHNFSKPWITSLFLQAHYLLHGRKLPWWRQPKSRQVWNS